MVALAQTCALTFELRLPWWHRIYFWTLAAFHNSYLLNVDPEIAAAFIVRHTKIRIAKGKWEWLRDWTS